MAGAPSAVCVGVIEFTHGPSLAFTPPWPRCSTPLEHTPTTCLRAFMSGSLVPSAESSGIPQLAYPPSFSADPFGQQPQDPAAQIRRLVSALFRYKWLVAAIVLVGAAGGYTFTKLLRKEYTVHATIWIATDNASNRASGPIRSGELFPTNSWPDLLGSFKILDDVTQRLRLYVTPSNDQDAALFYSFGIAPGYRTGPFLMRIDRGTRRYTLLRDGVPVDSGAVTDSI